MQVPSSLHGGDKVVPSLHYGGRDVPDWFYVVYEVVVAVKPAPIDKVVTGVYVCVCVSGGGGGDTEYWINF